MAKRHDAVVRAATFIGVTESPKGSNRGPQIDEWQQRCNNTLAEPWCGKFLWSMFDDVGQKLRSIPNPAYVGSWVDWGHAHKFVHARPFKGDVVAYSWGGKAIDDHIGSIERVLALPRLPGRTRYWIRTVEGNTGDAVNRRWRWVNPQMVCFIRIPDSAT